MKRLFYFLLDVQVARSGGTVHQACPHGRQIYMAKFAMLFTARRGVSSQRQAVLSKGAASAGFIAGKITIDKAGDCDYTNHIKKF